MSMEQPPVRTIENRVSQAERAIATALGHNQKRQEVFLKLQKSLSESKDPEIASVATVLAHYAECFSNESKILADAAEDLAAVQTYLQQEKLHALAFVAQSKPPKKITTPGKLSWDFREGLPQGLPRSLQQHNSSEPS